MDIALVWGFRSRSWVEGLGMKSGSRYIKYIPHLFKRSVGYGSLHLGLRRRVLNSLVFMGKCSGRKVWNGHPISYIQNPFKPPYRDTVRYIFIFFPT